ncbi:MAG TPA: AMP-binding protein [Gemmatimonadales bacterium]|nr:AMP-binding protein [Gemmatimonadales bacterium]
MSSDASTPLTLPELFEASVERFADNTLVLEKRDGTWRGTSYAETRALVHRCAAGLLDLGLGKGDRVALISEGRREWVVAELGILYAGAIDVPISVKIEELPELRFRLSHSGCRMAVVSGSQARKVLGIRAELPELETVVLLDDPGELPPGTVRFADLLARGDAALAAHPDRVAASWRSLEGSDPANICYTSGTTADPKGIVLSHRNYTANIAQGVALYPLPPHAVTLLILPWDHAFAHTCGVYALGSTGGAFACVQTGKTPMETLRNIPANIRETRPTLLLSAPALAKTFRKGVEKGVRARGLLSWALFRAGVAVAKAHGGLGFDRGRGARALLKPLVALFDAVLFRRIRENFGGRLEYFVGGAALLDLELQRFFYAIGIPMYQGYGLTEAAPVISSNTPRRHKLGSSGTLVPHLDLRIVGEDGRGLPAGEKGEIVVRGENVMLGYWKNDTATAEALRDGWLHTGDLGYLDRDGFLYVLGREKSLLIGHDGEKYSPEGIEETVVDRSRFIDQIMLHNNQSPATVALLVPNREALAEWMERHGMAPDRVEGQDAALRLLEAEIDAYRGGGRHAGMFPERWLPSTFAVLDEGFTEQNRMLNSTMKMVRGRIEEQYRDRIAQLHRADGAQVTSAANREAIRRVLA